MKKSVYILLIISVIFMSIFTGIIIKISTNKNIDMIDNMIKVSDAEILDECTEEYEILEQGNALKVNSEDEKISPNCILIINKYFNKCAHTTTQYLQIPIELVNKKEEELNEMYKDFNIEKFSSNEIILSKNMSGECGEHYMVRNLNGKVAIFNIESDGTEKLYEETGITTEYLTDEDKNNMEKGIVVYGKQNLNQLIEDYE